MCVQKIAKLFFERAKHAVPFQIKYIIHKKIYQPLGPQNTQFCKNSSVRVTKRFVVDYILFVAVEKHGHVEREEQNTGIELIDHQSQS